jgi:hypothetical protein
MRREDLTGGGAVNWRRRGDMLISWNYANTASD